ncbi:MAG TPA: hypothetical protein VKR24_04610 [Candidatus Limnocylindrales bacterium]|nr:hypothetical protein [Candidatus Limnocylindrales bacterium]
MRLTSGLTLARAVLGLTLGVSLGLPAGGVAAVRAAGPVAPSMAILGDAHGFRPVGEADTGHGTRLATFRGPLGTIRMVGAPGGKLSMTVVPPDRTGHASIRVGVSGGGPKSGGPGPSQAQNLADLGLRAAATTPLPADGTPWASTCLNLNVLGGAVQGSACNNVYKKHTNGGDWYLSNEYWASASLTGWQGPLGLHLQAVALETTWHPGNTIYSVAPTTTQPFGACTPWTVTASATNNGVTIGGSISGQICPSTLGPWNLRIGSTYPNSGAIWTGNVQGVANYQGSEGVQLVHSPPAVEANWDDYYTIGYCNGICF